MKGEIFLQIFNLFKEDTIAGYKCISINALPISSSTHTMFMITSIYKKIKKDADYNDLFLQISSMSNVAYEVEYQNCKYICSIDKIDNKQVYGTIDKLLFQFIGRLYEEK